MTEKLDLGKFQATQAVRSVAQTLDLGVTPLIDGKSRPMEPQTDLRPEEERWDKYRTAEYLAWQAEHGLFW